MPNKISHDKLMRQITKRNFLHTFFDNPQKYDEVEVNGYWLINQFNKATGYWDVAIYTKESYNKRKQFLSNKRSGNVVLPL